MSNTSNLDLERPDRGDSGWHTSLNSNMDKLDTGYGNNVATVADLPQMYIETGTFNTNTGDTITLPVAVDAINEYSVEITATTGAGTDPELIWVEKGLANFVVKCIGNNTTDTFDAIIYYIGDINSYGGSIYRRWYVSPDASIADHGDTADTGSFAWVLDQIGATLATVELPGNKTYTITTATAVPDNVNVIPQKGAVFDGAGALTFDNPEQILCSRRQQIFGASITPTFTNKGIVYPQWWGAVADGASDDQPEIQKALTASVGGLCKLLPSANEYLIGAPIVVSEGNRLVGSGTVNTIVKLDDNVDDNVIETDTWTAQTGYCHYFEVSDFKIEGNKANNASTSAGIAVFGMGETAKISRMFIHECNDYGLQLAGVGAPARITNISIQDSGVAAIYSSQTGGAVTTFDSMSGDSNVIFAKFTGGTIQAVFTNPKIEDNHDPVFDCKFDDPSGSFSMITVVGGYVRSSFAETDIFKTDTVGGSADSVAITFINFRQYNYTNLINDVDNGNTYATAALQTHYGLYQFMAKNRIYGDQSEIFIPFNVPIKSEDSIEGTEFELLKQTGSGLRFQDATGGGFKLREGGMSAAETLIRHKTSAITCNGATETWAGALSAGTIILGVTARVTTLITGATSLDVGISGGDADFFIDGMAVALDTTADIADSNAAFTAPLINQSTKDILVTAVGGNFTAGVLRLVVHYIDLTASTS